MEISQYGKWVKIYPVPTMKDKVLPIVAEQGASFEFKKLDTQTNLLVIPSFAFDYKSIIDSIIEGNKQSILKTPHLIIDVRDNFGGSNSCFEKLSPLLYTTPVFTQAYSVLATEDNIQLFKKALDSTHRESYEEMLNQIKAMEKNKNTWLQLYPADTITHDTIYRYPSKVAILMNGNSASSTEFFIQEAMASSKVTVFGKPSLGAIDYVEYLMENSLPCTLYQYHYPTMRLDALGNHPGKYVIKPQVDIPDGTSN